MRARAPSQTVPSFPDMVTGNSIGDPQELVFSVWAPPRGVDNAGIRPLIGAGTVTTTVIDYINLERFALETFECTLDTFACLRCGDFA